MKPNLGLFVLSFYHILPRFSTKAAVNKPQQNRNSAHQNQNKPRISLLFWTFLYLSALVGWESGLVSQRRAAIFGQGKEQTKTKFLRVPVGQTFDRLRPCSPVSVAPKGTEAPKLYRFRWGFVSVSFGYCRKTVRQPCLLFPAVKVYAISKKFWRCPF